MLSKEEKKEMLADGKSASRKKDFRHASMPKSNYSLDNYIKFLTSIQKIFPFKASSAYTKTQFNKL